MMKTFLAKNFVRVLTVVVAAFLMAVNLFAKKWLVAGIWAVAGILWLATLWKEWLDTRNK